MNRMIEVWVPFVEGSAQRNGLLMRVYVRDDNEFFGDNDPEIKDIHAVELFASPVKEGVDPSTATSLFLSTIHHDSKLSGEDFSSGARPWKFKWVQGGQQREMSFKPDLTLELKLRFPLAWAKVDPKTGKQVDEQKLRLEFKFKDVKNAAGVAQGKADKCFFYKVHNFSRREGNKEKSFELEAETCFPLGQLFDNKVPQGVDSQHVGETLTGFRDDKDDNFLWQPKLFFLEQLCEGEPPRGVHHWTISFRPLKNPLKRGLEFKYNSVARKNDPTRPGWGKTEETASKLWPLGIAPLGIYRTEAELPNLQEKDRVRGDLVLSQLSDEVDAISWGLKARWKRQPEAALQSFTPLGAWNRLIVDHHKNSLRTVKGGTPASVIPYFDEEAAPSAAGDPEVEWETHYELTDKNPHAPFEEFSDDSKEWMRKEEFDLRLDGSHPIKLVQGGQVSVSLVQFVATDGEPVKRRFRLAPLAPLAAVVSDVSPEDAGPKILFELTDVLQRDAPPPDPTGENWRKSKVGALDLYFAPPGSLPAGKEAGKAGDVTVTLQGLGGTTEYVESTTEPGAFVLRRPAWLPGVFVHLYLQLDAFGPGDQDRTPLETTRADERRPSTIIKPFDQSGVKRGTFLLYVEEESTRSLDHRLEMRLEQLEPSRVAVDGEFDIDLLIIDTEPFLVARVQAKIDLPNVTEVGNWTGDAPGGASWELSDLGGGFKLVLPPQAVGEEFLRTYDDNQDNQKPLDYKFSPPAVFRLTRTPFKQSFSEAPWNLRRLLGYPGQRQPGMGVHSLEFELMYGLTTEIKSDPAELNLTELSALVGSLPAPIRKEQPPPFRVEGIISGSGQKSADIADPAAAFNRFRDGYQGKWRILRTRLAHLLPRAAAQKSPFLTLEQGVGYRFRSTRQTAIPFERDPNQLRGKLRGGVDWGFTSENIWKEVTGSTRSNTGQLVIGSARSSSGKIVNPSFTALGGGGYQKAGFANDKSTLYTDTFLGRTFFYSIERIGRIGRLWNTAKHVIIYERSVVHSQQFKDAPLNDPMPRWLGRPLMRKMVEYVEILQPERAYPEFGEAPRVRGFVRACKFPQTVIYVDSKWGRDIPGGWVVPLYNPAADPAFYKRPDVTIKLTVSEKQQRAAGEEELKKELPFIWGSCRNQEDLIFYTSTVEKTSDTDQWPPVPGVDYPVAGVPVPPKSLAENVEPAAADPGYERFTLRLDTGNVPVNILSERLAATTDAVIENVTVVRRALEGQLAVDQFQQNVEGLLRVGREYEGAFRREAADVTERLRDAATTVEQAIERINSFGQSADGIITNLQNEYAAKFGKPTGALPAKLGEMADILQQKGDELRAGWEKKLNELAERARREVQNVLARTNPGVEARKHDVQELLAWLTQHVAEAESALHEIEGKIARARKHVEKLRSANIFAAVIDEAVRQAQAAAADPVRAARLFRKVMAEGVVRLERENADFRRWLESIAPSLPGVAEQYRRMEEQYIELIKRSLPEEVFPLTPAKIKAAKDALTAYYDRVDEYVAALEAKFAATLAKVREINGTRRQAVEQLKAMEQALIAAPLSELQTALTVFESRLGDLRRKFPDEFFKVAADALKTNEIKQEVESALGKFEELRASVEEQRARARRVTKEVLEGLRLGQGAKLDEFRRAAQDLADAAGGQAAAALAPYERWVRDRDLQNLDAKFNDAAKKLGDRTLRLVQAHGLPPVGEALAVNRRRLSYYYQELRDDAQNVFRQLENAVDITPAKALVNRVRELESQGLKSLGIELPTNRIAEKFEPYLKELKNFKLKDVLPDFAGINLESLLGNVDFPIQQSEAVKITHGLDPTTHRPWAQCDVNMQLAGETALFTVASLTISIVGANFKARTRIAFQEGGGPRREVEASIFADWELTLGGQRVMTIKNSTLRYDDSGRIRFEMGARDIELAEVLKFITDLLETTSAGAGKSGLSFGLIKEGMIPVGARASLNLALPALQTGAFSVSNILLNAFFELAFKRIGDRSRFYLAVGLGVSSKERPFNLSILCLGGGGWFVVKAMYLPPMFGGASEIRAMLSIGISAGASLPFDIGVASGGVYFFVGVGVEFSYGGGHSALTFLLRVSLIGEVVVLGIISVQIMLALEARYGQGSLVCTGTLRVKIKICWCFTLSVSTGFTMRLAGSGQSGGDGLLADGMKRLTTNEAVDEYMRSFGG